MPGPAFGFGFVDEQRELMSASRRICAIANIHNLYSAWRRVRRAGDTSKGIDGVSVSEFGRRLRHYIDGIHAELLAGTCTFKELVPVAIEKGAGSYRPLSIPTVGDRLVMRATYNVVINDCSDLSNPCSYGYLPGVKLEDAVRRVAELHAAGRAYVLEADIEKFFDRVDRDRVKEMLAQRYSDDAPVLELLTRTVNVALGDESHLTPEQRAVFPQPNVGIPQGGGLSPLFANIYLLPLDQEMLSRGFDMVRWADDFVVLTEGPDDAEEAYLVAKHVVEALCLRLHPLERTATAKTRVRRYGRGFDFLGLRFDAEGVRPARDKVDAFRARVRDIAQSADSVRELLWGTHLYVSGWRGSYKFCDISVSPAMWQQLDEEVAQHLTSRMQQLGIELPSEWGPAELLDILGVRQISGPW